MGSLDVSNWPASKVTAIVEEIKAKHHGAPIQLTWQPPHHVAPAPTETPTETIARRNLVAQRLKG